MKGKMQLLKTVSGLTLSLVAALAVSACSETAVQDLLGSGKSSTPDASQVTVSQNLSMPPDLQLRAPPDGPSDDNQAGVAPQPVQPIQPAPAAIEAQPAPRPLTSTQTAAAPQPQQDAYQRYGISKTYPDGKPKPDRVLVDELRKAELAEKRKINPNYGTFWNMGALWHD